MLSEHQICKKKKHQKTRAQINYFFKCTKQKVGKKQTNQQTNRNIHTKPTKEVA